MRFVRPVRLPLQIGVAAVWNMARSALAMLILLGMSLGHGVVWLLFGGALGIVLGLVLLIYAALSAATAGTAWPTDLFIDAIGIRVEGGLEKAKSYRWDELDVERCTVEDKEEKQRSLSKTVARTLGVIVFSFLIVPIGLIALVIDKIRPVKSIPVPDLDEGHTTVSTLMLAPRSGNPIALAEAERPIERASLTAILATFRAVAGGETQSNEAPVVEQPAVLACPGCGAPVALADVHAVICRYCGNTVTVPAALRARLERAEQAGADRSRVESLVRELIEQPSAERAGTRVTWGAWTMHLAWFAAVVTTVAFWWRERLDNVNLLLFIAAAAAVISAAFVFVRVALVDRLALRLLTVEFGAAPAGSEGAYRCRACGAPLAADAGLLARCGYCAADNILGIDLVRQRAPAAGQVRTLEDALRHRHRERLLWGTAAFGAVALLGAGVYAAYEGTVYRSAITALSGRCYDGDARACLELGTLYREGTDVEEDRDRAATLFDRACGAGSAEGCYQAGESHYYRSDEGESAEAAERYRKACALGHARACERLQKR